MVNKSEECSKCEECRQTASRYLCLCCSKHICADCCRNSIKFSLTSRTYTGNFCISCDNLLISYLTNLEVGNPLVNEIGKVIARIACLNNLEGENNNE